MHLLLTMLAVGLLAAAWGFMACFLPDQWLRLTEKIGLASYWSESQGQDLHPVLKSGNRIAGFMAFVVGCWFAYIAGSGIYRVITKQGVLRVIPPSNSTGVAVPTPGLTALTVFTVIVGVLMALFPSKALFVFGRAWPAARSVKPSAAPAMNLFIRVAGLFFAVAAFMSLIR